MTYGTFNTLLLHIVTAPVNVNDDSETYPNHQIQLPLPPKTSHQHHTSSLFASKARNASQRAISLGLDGLAIV